ncbi:MAG: putative aminohydrolase SsnA [Caldiserica bacterium]|jgi:putative selenium metabolism protein SsnA|nr:putative aminohydrolase SsnA [Caldisericota bacterium]MDH7563181.1 putative aminohydrolase SsnA [Caldisericota bacterium]
MLIGGGPLFTFGKEDIFLENGGVRVEGGLVKEVDSWTSLRKKFPQEEFFDTQGGVIIPGMTCAHHHFYSSFARGMSLKGKSPRNFGEILQDLWWSLDKKLTPEDIYFSALVALIDAIKCGTTSILDHHASPKSIKGSLRMIAQAVKKAGVRACLCYEVSDRDGPQAAKEGLEENADFLRETKIEDSDFLKATFGLHASFTLSQETLISARDMASALGAGFHIHVAEGEEDQEDSLRSYGKRVIERLRDSGILGEKTLAIHCIHVDQREIGILKDTKTMVVHNPSSNMNNAVGYAPVEEMISRGITCGLGTDGMSSDMFQELKTAFFLLKHQSRDPRKGWEEIQKIYFQNNPKIFAKFFPHPLGSLSPGSYADMVVLDYDPPTPLNRENFLGHLLFAIQSRNVRDVIVGGNFLMRDRQILTLDEGEVLKESRKLALKLWERF